MNTDYLLSDEFVAFSQKIATLLEAKKALKKELKEYYEDIQSKIAALEDQAKRLQDEFEAGLKSEVSCCGGHACAAPAQEEEKHE